MCQTSVAIFAQDPPNKWLLEGIATGEQAAFETGRLEDQVINPSPVGRWNRAPFEGFRKY